MVSLIEHSDRSVRRYQRRFEDGGLAALGQSALTCRWRRPTLQRRTAHEMWAARPPVDDDRDVLHDEVEHRTARLRVHGVAEDLELDPCDVALSCSRSLLSSLSPGVGICPIKAKIRGVDKELRVSISVAKP